MPINNKPDPDFTRRMDEFASKTPRAEEDVRMAMDLRQKFALDAATLTQAKADLVSAVTTNTTLMLSAVVAVVYGAAGAIAGMISAPMNEAVREHAKTGVMLKPGDPKLAALVEENHAVALHVMLLAWFTFKPVPGRSTLELAYDAYKAVTGEEPPKTFIVPRSRQS